MAQGLGSAVILWPVPDKGVGGERFSGESMMKTILPTLMAGLLSGALQAAPVLDEKVFGKMLGGWKQKGDEAADYEISGSKYRTWKPHISPTLDGGVFISVRIDHLRGVFASNDHASLELTFDKDSNIDTARSTIALQGRKISSDLIQGGAKAGASVVGMDRAAKVGTDLIGNLTSKLLREEISEPGRVGFPAALRHNYNLLCLSVRNSDDKAVPLDGQHTGVAIPAVPVEEEGVVPVVPAAQPPTAEPVEGAAPKGAVGPAGEPVEEQGRRVPPLEVDQHGKPKKADLEKEKKD